MPLNGSRGAVPLVHITSSQTYVIMNRAQAEAIIAETLSRVKNLESEIEGLTGKEARNARFRVIAEMKRMRSAFSRILIDDERILAGKEALTPSNRDPNIPSQKVGY